MIKKLDKLILKAFIWPFIATFFITIFVLMLQIIWKYIDDLVGKGLDFLTLAKFIIFASATLVTYALPIAILLSSIMTFGKLGENFELVAIKSSGIPLLRFMRPLLFVAVILSGITFLFANYVIPVANLKFAVIYSDIYRKSPAFDLKDGVFYNGFRGYSIKVAKKEKDTALKNIIIYEQSTNPQDNCVISEKGIMRMSADKKFLEFKLQNGSRYEEKGDASNPGNEFIRLSFKEYNKLFDLSQLEMQQTADSLFKNKYQMKTIRQLDVAIDSLKKFPDSFVTKTKLELGAYLTFLKYKDSTAKKDTNLHAKKFYDLIPASFNQDSLLKVIDDRTLGVVASMRNTLEINSGSLEIYTKELSLHKVEWHRKFSLACACLVLFFIGAPLGSIIRRGGLGMPLVAALVFFVAFHLLNMFGEKFVKNNALTPFEGMWLSIAVLTPIGAFLTYKATRDSQLFSKEFYYRSFKRFRPILSIFRKEKSAIS